MYISLCLRYKIGKHGVTRCHCYTDTHGERIKIPIPFCWYRLFSPQEHSTPKLNDTLPSCVPRFFFVHYFHGHVCLFALIGKTCETGWHREPTSKRQLLSDFRSSADLLVPGTRPVAGVVYLHQISQEFRQRYTIYVGAGHLAMVGGEHDHQQSCVFHE